VGPVVKRKGAKKIEGRNEGKKYGKKLEESNKGTQESICESIRKLK
jgi:hypothetical protein